MGWFDGFDGVGGFAGCGCGFEACSCVGGDVGVWFGWKYWGGVGSAVGFWFGGLGLGDGFVGLVVVAPFSGEFVCGGYTFVHMMIDWL